MLSEATIKELQEILKEEFAYEVDLSAAAQMATIMIRYADLLIKINNKNYNE